MRGKIEKGTNFGTTGGVLFELPAWLQPAPQPEDRPGQDGTDRNRTASPQHKTTQDKTRQDKTRHILPQLTLRGKRERENLVSVEMLRMGPKMRGVELS